MVIPPSLKSGSTRQMKYIGPSTRYPLFSHPYQCSRYGFISFRGCLTRTFYARLSLMSKFLDCYFDSFLYSALPPPPSSLNQSPRLLFFYIKPACHPIMSALTVKNVLVPRNCDPQRPSPLAPLVAKNVSASSNHDPGRPSNSVPLAVKNVLAPGNCDPQRRSPLAPLVPKNVSASSNHDPGRLSGSAPLAIKDILPFSSDFDPLQSVRSYPIPREQGAPCPFITTLTCEEFRTFWSIERVAFQWVTSSEKNSRDIFKNKENRNQLLPAKKDSRYSGYGRPCKYDWTVKHDCRRGRQEKTLAIDRDSVGVRCPATIRFRKLVGQEQVEVVYNWRHNHDTSMESRALIPQGANERNWSKEKVSRGLDWKGIKGILRPSDENLQSVMDSLPSFEYLWSLSP